MESRSSHDMDEMDNQKPSFMVSPGLTCGGATRQPRAGPDLERDAQLCKVSYDDCTAHYQKLMQFGTTLIK